MNSICNVAYYGSIRTPPSDSGSTSIGPQRTRRAGQRRVQKPYSKLGERNVPPAANHRRAALRLPALMWPPCPRGGVPFVCAPTASAELLWDPNPLDAPTHSSQLVVTRFLGLLTANLLDSAILSCATQMQQVAHCLQDVGCSAGSFSTVVEQCATAFKSNDASNFTLMIRLIQLKSRVSR